MSDFTHNMVITAGQLKNIAYRNCLSCLAFSPFAVVKIRKVLQSIFMHFHSLEIAKAETLSTIRAKFNLQQRQRYE
jgi:hypothetical protein